MINNDNNIKYVIPLTSTKQKHKKWRDFGADYFRIFEIIDTRKYSILPSDITVDIVNRELIKNIIDSKKCYYKQKLLSILDLRRMFPIIDSVYHDANMSFGIDYYENRRTDLLLKELLFIEGILPEIEKNY